MHQWTGAARFLWNLALEQRTTCRRRGINKIVQCRDLTELRAEVDWILDLPAQVAQQVLADLDLACQRWGVGLAHRPGRKRRFRNEASLRFPQGVEVRRLNRRWGAVRLQKLGWVKFRWTRELVGTVKNATVSRDAAGWQVAFCLETAEKPVEPNGLSAVGVNRGVAIAFMTSDGTPHDRPMWRPKEKERLVWLERLKARQVKGSNRYRATCGKIARLHHRATNRRRDFAHQTSCDLAKNHGLVAIENLWVPAMTASAAGTVEEPGRNVAAKAGLNRAILDKGWGLVNQQLAYKCEWYGSQRIEVPARNTSLECPVCGHVSRDNRPLRAVFLCAACGHGDHADRNAAINIRERGIKLALAGGLPVAGRKVLRTWRQPAQEAVA